MTCERKFRKSRPRDVKQTLELFRWRARPLFSKGKWQLKIYPGIGGILPPVGGRMPLITVNIHLPITQKSHTGTI